MVCIKSIKSGKAVNLFRLCARDKTNCARDIVDAQVYHVERDADNPKILAKILCGANNRRIDEMLPD
jgi:hypothetical protein